MIEINKNHKKIRFSKDSLASKTLKVAVIGTVISISIYSGSKMLKKNNNDKNIELYNNIASSLVEEETVEVSYNEEKDNYSVFSKDSSWEIPSLVGLCAALGAYSVFNKFRYEKLKEDTIKKAKESDMESFTFNFDYSNSISGRKHR